MCAQFVLSSTSHASAAVPVLCGHWSISVCRKLSESLGTIQIWKQRYFACSFVLKAYRVVLCFLTHEAIDLCGFVPNLLLTCYIHFHYICCMADIG